MDYKTYEITVSDKTLVCDSKILINKYDNKVSRLHFTYADGMSGNFYIAMSNPENGTYFIDPIVDEYYDITSAVTVYPGRWTAVLIVVDNDYEITDNTIDQSKTVYVSNEFNKIIVHDNFLNEDDKNSIDPIQNAAIEAALESLESSRTALANMVVQATQSANDAADYASQAATSASNAESYATQCQNYLNNVSNIRSEIQDMLNEIRSTYSSIQSVYNEIRRNGG